MREYAAELVDEDGIARRLTLTGRGRAEALGTLPTRARDSLQALAPAGGSEPLPEVALARALRDLAALLEAGLPLDRALRRIAAGLRRGRLTDALAQAAAASGDGASLADALAAGGGELASPLVQGLVRAGERSGAVPAYLGELADLLTRLDAARARAAAAVSYPLLVSGLAVGIAAAGCVLGAPAADAIVRLSASTAREVPWLVRGVAAAGERPDLVLAAGAALVLALLLLPLALGRGLARAPLRGRGLPGLGRPVRQALVLRSLAALLARGMAPGEAWSLTAAALGRIVGRRRAERDRLEPALAEGVALARALADARLVTPAEARVLTAVGERGGEALGAELAVMGEERLRAFERRARGWGAALELALELALGAAVLIVATQLLAVATRLP